MRLPYKDQKRLLIYSFRLLLSTVFFNRRSVSLTLQDFCFTLDKSPPPPSFDVAPTASSAYFSRSCLRASLLRVTCDLDYFDVIVRYWLRVRIRSEAHMIPDIAAEKAIARPMYVPGQQSPQPIVPIVTMVHHKKSANDMKSGLLSSARLNILEKIMTKLAQRMAKECRGQVLKKDLAPKEPQLLVLQMRHILLALVDRQMEELMIALQRRQILPIMMTSNSEFRVIGKVSPKTGQVSCRTTSSATRLGCTSSTKTSIQMLFTHWRKGLDLLRLISCFAFSCAFLKYLTKTKASMSSVRADCSPRIAFLCSLVKESRASNIDMRMEVSPSKVNKNLASSNCQCRNLVKCESSNWRYSQTQCRGCNSSSKIYSAVIPSQQLVMCELAQRCLSLSFSHLEKASFLNLVTGSNSSIQKIGIFINGG